ncbi:MAG TPA: hypothetical protein VK879_16450, partial [Candidatus Sulfomarinibacteraceae bacterium]|nr:hypothetical protein [Candidatus Sulfomarinibacteraceae bacterium]
MSEAKLKSYLMQMLSSHFQIRPEVEGTFIPYGTKVILNYLMYPKPHLIERGFDPVWFGVEVKWPGGRGGGNPKGLRVAYQAITYHWSEFDGEMPAFVVIYPGPDEF